VAARARNDPLRDLGLHNVAGLDYAALARKLVAPSEWLGTRYYIGQVRQVGNTELYADQRRFLPARLDAGVFHDLLALARRHQRATVMIEKAVDVMAERDEFDAAYLLSADGDFTHAVGVVRSAGKRVYVASPSSGAQLASVANAFIRLDQGWFRDCYRV
jgi:uncharacterized LabA/DUF88 family protein